MIRSICFAVTFYGVTATMAVLYLPLIVLPRRVFHGFALGWVRLMFAAIRGILGIRHELRGLENRPDGPAIYASKHQSAWDVLIYNLIIPDCAYVLKRELYKIPLWGWYVWRVGSVGIDRAGGARALRGMVSEATAYLQQGRSIVLFPQGTRTPVGESQPYLPGAAALYLGTKYPVVPVALNSGLFWPRRAFRKNPGVITVEFLPPIEPGLSRRAFLKELENRIEPATRLLEQEGGSSSENAT
ncbi:MAG: 1-acyl-sn-glycerol-3-phosphate acyltransferase [Alphaproteobacteria bacterium]|nr:1-acyl-sn-glycerol-3-phosphate acyltransferase [Alphaproteobacteria bacterium]